MKFFIQSRRHAWSGDDAVWWRPKSAGYTRDVDQAGEYTEEEARARVDGCHGEDRMVPVEVARGIAVRHVLAERLDAAMRARRPVDAGAAGTRGGA